MMSDYLSPDTRLLIGRKLSGRYVLSSLISTGKFTQTWEATDLVLSRNVAVKLTNPNLVSETAFLSKFRSEARAISRLNHPSIVSVLDTTGDDEIEAIVMELVEEETLYEFISRHGPLSVHTMMPLLNRIIDALVHAHEHGLIHGDLGPEKIFLCPDRGTKVSGFGFNESTSLLEVKQNVIPTAASQFLSPEQKNKNVADEKSDVFALGKLTEFMITGSENNESGLIDVNVENTKIFKAILKATAGEPSERYSSVVEFQDDIESAISNTESNKGEDSDFARKPQSIDGQRLFTGFLTFGMVFTFVLGIIFATNLDDSLFGSDDSSTSISTSSSETADAPVSTDTSSEDQSSSDATNEEANTETIEEEPETSVSPIFETVSISGARDYDPLGDGVEHPELIENLLDEDPSTIWYSETYANRSLGFLKDGVGIVVELKKSFPLQSLFIETSKSGWSGDIYVSETVGANLADWGTPSTSISASQGNATVDLTGATGSTILIWFTDLGDDPPPGVRMEISEIDVS